MTTSTDGEGAGAAASAASAATAAESGSAPESAESGRERFAEGRRWFEQGRADRALACFREARELEPDDARVRSWYGLTLALAERRFEEGAELCRSALRQEFFHPEQYLNMARLHLSFGFKSEALRYLRRGRMIDPGDEAIREALEELGERRPQVLRFLPRQHLLNRWLGRARARLLSVGRQAAA